MKVQLGQIMGDETKWYEGSFEAPGLDEPVVATGEHDGLLMDVTVYGPSDYQIEPAPLTLRAVAVRVARSTQLTMRPVED